MLNKTLRVTLFVAVCTAALLVHHTFHFSTPTGSAEGGRAGASLSSSGQAKLFSAEPTGASDASLQGAGNDIASRQAASSSAYSSFAGARTAAAPTNEPTAHPANTSTSTTASAAEEISTAAPSFTAPLADWSAQDPIFSRPMRGEEAVAQAEALGAELELRNGVSIDSLQQSLRQDSDLWLDRSGHLVNICAGLVARSTAGTPASSPSAIPNSTDSFKLHSLPGCGRVIYLDFTGHTTSGTPWNSSFTGGASIVSAPFDTDGAPAPSALRSAT